MRAILSVLVLASTLVAGGCASSPLGGREVRVGVSADYPPIVFEEKGDLRGVEPDLVAAIAKDLGWEVRFVDIELEDQVLSLLSGKIDVIMAGLSITSERAKLVAFTKPYLQIGQMALIRSEDAARLTPAEKIYRLDSRVGFQVGTTGEVVTRTLEHATPVPFPTVSKGIAALRAGEIDYFVHDAPTVWRYASAEQGPGKLLGLFEPMTEEHLAFAVRRSDPDLRLEMDQALARIQWDGRLQAILDRWISSVAAR